MRNESTDISTPLRYANHKKLLIFRAYLNICAYTSHHYIGQSRALFRQNRDYLYTIHISSRDNYQLLKFFLFRFVGILHYIKPFYLHSRQIAAIPYRSQQLHIFRSNDRRFFVTPSDPVPFRTIPKQYALPQKRLQRPELYQSLLPDRRFRALTPPHRGRASQFRRYN